MMACKVTRLIFAGNSVNVAYLQIPKTTWFNVSYTSSQARHRRLKAADIVPITLM
jgi:hypothetical protein